MCLITQKLVDERLDVLRVEVSVYQSEGRTDRAALLAQEKLLLERWFRQHQETCNASH